MKSLLPLLALLALAGCKRDGPPAAEATRDTHDDHAEGRAAGAATDADHGEHGNEDANLLHLDTEMLRDLRLTTAKVEARSGGDGVLVLGELQVNADAYAEIGAPIPARVLKVRVQPGDTVHAGDPLVELSSPELGKARAAYLGAKARADLARRTAERKRGLAAEQIVASGELQTVEAELSAADAELKAARAGLTALGATVQDTEADGAADASRMVLRAPLAGTVIDRDAALGRMADPAKPLLRIGDLSSLWLVVHAFERDAVRLRTGATARVTLPALPGRTFPARVGRIGQQVEAASRTLPVWLALSNPDGLLRPGMSASAWIALGDGKTSILSVPGAALQRVREGWCAFVPRDEATFELRPVGRGRDLGGEVEILSGLKADETVVVEGAFLLKAELEKSRGEGDHHEH